MATRTKNCLKAGERLGPHEKLISFNRRFELRNVPKKAVVLVDTKFDEELWVLSAQSRLCNLQLQGDSNLVFSVDGSVFGKPMVLWASNTNGRGGDDMYLVLHDDGNLILKLKATDKWETGTRVADADVPRDDWPLKPFAQGAVVCGADRILKGQHLPRGQYLQSPNGAFTARISDQGVFRTRAKAYPDLNIWFSLHSHPSDSDSPMKVIVQDDANVVMLAGDKPIWATNTNMANSTDAQLLLHDDGNLKLYGGKQPWSSDIPYPLFQYSPVSKIKLGQKFLVGQELKSRNGQYVAKFTREGRFVVIKTTTSEPIRYYYTLSSMQRAFSCTFEREEISQLPVIVMRSEFEHKLWSSEPDRRRLFNLDDGNNAMQNQETVKRWFGDRKPPTDHSFMLRDDGALAIWYADDKTVGFIWDSSDLASGPSHAPPNKLQTGDFLTRDTCLMSMNGQYKLIYQSSGDLVLYKGAKFDQKVWSSDTGNEKYRHNTGRVTQMLNGSIRITDVRGTVVWETRSASNVSDNWREAVTVLENEGKLCTYVDGKSLWSSKPTWSILGTSY